MRFVTFSRKDQARIGVLYKGDHIIDLAEVNRRNLRGGQPPFMSSMQARWICAHPANISEAWR